MKKLIVFLIGLTTVFTFSAQRLNQRGEKMVRHIKSRPVNYNQNGYPYLGVSSYDIYFSYDTNDEIYKVNVVAPRYDMDSVVLIKDKKGITWKNFYNKKKITIWPNKREIFLDEQGRVSRVDDIEPRCDEYSCIFRYIYHYIDEPNDGDVCLDVDRHVLYRFRDGSEVYDGIESNIHILSARQLARYDGGLITDTRNKNAITGELDKYGAVWWEGMRSGTIIDHCFINDTNVELYTLLYNK